MVFPKDIMWLAGAPGAGKATLTPYIMELRQLTLEPIEISSLLTTPCAAQSKSPGSFGLPPLALTCLFALLARRSWGSRP